MGASDLRGKRKLLSQFLEQKKNITSQAAYTNARIQSGQNHPLITVYYSTLPFFPGVSKCRENCGLREEPLLYPRKISTAKTRPVLLLALPEVQQHDKELGERRRRGPKDTASSARGSALPLLPPPPREETAPAVAQVRCTAAPVPTRNCCWAPRSAAGKLSPLTSQQPAVPRQLHTLCEKSGLQY